MAAEHHRHRHPGDNILSARPQALTLHAMSMNRQRPRKRASGRHVRHEWVGGRYRLPFFVKGETTGSTLRPDVDLWLELPDEQLVGTRMIDPGDDESAAAFVAQILASPMSGDPRRPDRIRTADSELADDLRRRFPEIDVVIGPTPEADAVLEDMLGHFADVSDEEASFLQDGAISEETVANLFESAGALYSSAPWERAVDIELMRIDIPALGIDGACAMLCSGEDGRGLLLFWSLTDWERFADAFESRVDSEATFQPGTSFIALLYHRGADLPAALRREVSSHRWHVADAMAYPVVQYNDSDNAARPATESEVAIVSATATALASLFSEHGELLSLPDMPPIFETISITDEVDVRVAIPYLLTGAPDDLDAAADILENLENSNESIGHQFENLFGTAPGNEDAGSLGPNAKDAPQFQTHEITASRLRRIDVDLLQNIADYALERFGPEVIARALREVSYSSEPPNEFIMLSLAYQAPIYGKALAEHYLERCAGEMRKPEAAWLQAQLETWPSIWQIDAIVPGSGIIVTDQLSGLAHELHEPHLADTYDVGDMILARVVNFSGKPVLANGYLFVLPAAEGEHVVQRVRRFVKRRNRIPPARLREPGVSRYLIARWYESAGDDRLISQPE